MKGKKKKRMSEEFVKNLADSVASPFDPLGSYTGTSNLSDDLPNGTPTQDADDL